MRKVLTYDIADIVPYINWLYFFHAWGLSGKPAGEKEKMKQEALLMLKSWYGKYHTHALFRLMKACSDGDDIVLIDDLNDQINGQTNRSEVRIPMLRQQKVSADGQPNLCLSDFLRPIYMEKTDCLGIFCATVDAEIVELYRHDDYQSMLAQTLSDRLAEATAERMHQEVRTTFWGYAADEKLTMGRHHTTFSKSDTSINFLLDEILGMKEVGIRLTESGMMTPHASVSGLMFSHPKAHYFELGKIGEDQLRDYANRRGIPVELMRRFLQSSLMKK